jgi:hypothetical protein
MELHVRSYHRVFRTPDWVTAAVAGFVAGAVMMVLELLWAIDLMDTAPWQVSHMVAAVVLGPDVLQSSGFSAGIAAAALIVHYVLGIVFGMILAAILAAWHLDARPGAALLTGAVFGFLLYLFNFYGMTYVFPWFAELRNGLTMLAHIIFGMVAAAMYWYLEERPMMM